MFDSNKNIFLEKKVVKQVQISTVFVIFLQKNLKQFNRI